MSTYWDDFAVIRSDHEEYPDSQGEPSGQGSQDDENMFRGIASRFRGHRGCLARQGRDAQSGTPTYNSFAVRMAPAPVMRRRKTPMHRGASH